jgi:iron complex outermembrane recepter protein
MNPISNELSKAVRLALTVGAASVAVVPAVYAQDDAETLETITVVGSRIKRTDIETSQPVFVIERADLQRTGLTSVGDILQELTSNGATLNTTFNNGGNGETRVDLRNLGSNRTLVLVNGRRWVTTLDGAVDLNTIPISVIERVEVLKDGASAIYGSDAIAGVINITTRDTYDGAEANAYLGENEEGDGRTQLYDFTIGATTERSNIVFNASYAKQDPIFAGDRAISAVPLNGFPGNNVNVGASSTTPFGRFGRPGVPGTVTLIPGRAGTSPSDFKPFNLSEDGFNFAPDNYLQTPQERTGIFVQGRYDITDNISFNTTIMMNERKSEQLLAAIPFTLGAVFGNNVVVSRNNIYNPFGVDVTRAQYRNTRQLRSFNQDVDTYYFGGGFNGSFDLWDRSFAWDINGIYSDNEQLDVTFGQFNRNQLALGLGPSFIAADGTPTCGTAAAPIAGCVPINLFQGPDGFTQEMVDFASVNLKDQTQKELYNYTANITGDIFELPAGPLGFAAGYEYRREQGFFLPDAITASGATTGNAAQPTAGGFSLDEFYAEFNIPILKDLAFAQVLEFSVAARYSDYSNFGDTTNPKAGFRWKPINDLLFRGNWAKGFRAPAVSELFLGNSDSFPDLTDPCSQSTFDTGQVDAATRARCLAGFGGIAPVDPTYEQANTQIRITVGGNPFLDPEEATSRTLGLVYSPSWLEGMDVYLDWYNVEIVQAIGTQSGEFIADDCYVNENLAACNFITRGGDGEITDLFAGSQNLAGGTEVEGWDLTLNYRFDTSFGKFNINWDNAYTSYYGDVGQPEADYPQPSQGNVVGVYFDRNPFWRLKSNISTNWQYGDWGSTLGIRYLSDLTSDCSTPVAFGNPGLCDNPDGTGRFPSGEHTVDETWYVDLQGTWDAPWNGRVTAGIRNIFDEDPPVVYDTFANSFDPQYEIPGRFWYVQYSQKF